MVRSAIAVVLGLLLALSPLDPRVAPTARDGAAAPAPTYLSAARADDDDDGDDDDGDGGGGGGGLSGGGDGGGGPVWRPPQGEGFAPLRRLFGIAPQRPARRAAPQTPPPVAAEREIVAIGVSEALLGSLVSEGWVLLESVLLERIGERLVRLGLPDGIGLEDARASIADRAPDARVDLEHFYRPGSDPDAPPPWSDACAGPQCAAPRLVAWPAPPGAHPACAEGLRIGMIDSGINVAHDHLRDATIAVTLLDPEAERSDAYHGTSVAALLVGAPDSRTPGLLPRAELVAVDVFQGAPGNDLRAGAFALARGLERFVGAGVPVVNLSLAGPPNAVVERLVELLLADGVALVAASGNAGPRAEPAYPAAYAGVVAVTAVDRSGRVYRRAGRGPHVDLAAPGVEVWAAASVSGARPRTGTSFAAPFVTAAIALTAQANAAGDAATRLADRARDLGEPGRDEIYGAGLLQVGNVCDTPATALPAAGP
ncbi:S8 family serine peptidase [Salinarimonas ramus]|uniref:Peptidase S8 n=1 Tax=Salinarimonas ramus TaxID=690164 RepID=A0A917QKL2_9HYPH|nr:S8 family serine peptidase [Salinarimonas ramus]GGK55591.1 peptidase S8 [Salinarimonas ramus]